MLKSLSISTRRNFIHPSKKIKTKLKNSRKWNIHQDKLTALRRSVVADSDLTPLWQPWFKKTTTIIIKNGKPKWGHVIYLQQNSRKLNYHNETIIFIASRGNLFHEMRVFHPTWKSKSIDRSILPKRRRRKQSIDATHWFGATISSSHGLSN